MAGKQQWLDQGLTVLGELGARSITIERLADTLGLTKGSFYHHFKGMPGYKTELLDYYEAQFTTRYIQQVEDGQRGEAGGSLEGGSPEGGSPEGKLRALVRAVQADASDWRAEVELRAWAQQDEEVRAVQQRIDATRQAYLCSLWTGIVGDPDRADQLARLCYLTLIGAGHVLPPVDLSEVERLYERLISLTTAAR